MPVNNASVFPVYSAALIFIRISSHIFSIFSISGCELSPTVNLWIFSSDFCFHRLPHLGDYPLLCICINVWQENFDWFHHDRQKNQSWIYYFPALVRASPRYSRRYLFTQILKAYNVELRAENDVQSLSLWHIIGNPWIRCSLSAFQMALGFASRVGRSLLMSLLKSKPRYLAWREESFSQTLILRRCILRSLSIPISSRCHFWLIQC